MKASERAEAEAAVETLNRVRQIRVCFAAAWSRLDDLEPAAEQSLKACLRKAWEDWAAAYGIGDPAVQGPDVYVRKLDNVPSIDGDMGMVIRPS